MKTILVIDDDSTILEVTELALKEEGYRVVAKSTAEGVESIIQQEKPDVVLVDLFLPGRKGDELCNSLKADPDTANLPVILFSAHNSLKQIMQTCQADVYISKPFDLTELFDAISRLL